MAELEAEQDAEEEDGKDDKEEDTEGAPNIVPKAQRDVSCVFTYRLAGCWYVFAWLEQ